MWKQKVFICKTVVISLPTISESCVNWFYKGDTEKQAVAPNKQSSSVDKLINAFFLKLKL